MKKSFLLSFVLLSTIYLSNAQQFISTGDIEYEVKSNIKKTMGTSSWEEEMKANLPDFKTAYYTLTFNNNMSIYQHTGWPENDKSPEWFKRGEDKNRWFFDLNTGLFQIQKEIVGTEFVINDSIKPIQWKLTNETREIAGFMCRKAVGVIMDSVYVFAFYSEQIMAPVGPASIQGLPGAILGVTIPRLYTSYIARKVSVNNINTSNIKATVAKKPYNTNTFRSTIIERTKEWFSWNGETEESKQQRNRFLWSTFL